MATRVKYSTIVRAYTPCQNFMVTLAYNKTLYICQNEKFIHHHLTLSTFISLPLTSSKNIFLSCFIHLHFTSFNFIHFQFTLFHFIHLHFPLFNLIHLPFLSFNFIHLHFTSFNFIHLHFTLFNFIHLHFPLFNFIHLYFTSFLKI